MPIHPQPGAPNNPIILDVEDESSGDESIVYEPAGATTRRRHFASLPPRANVRFDRSLSMNFLETIASDEQNTSSPKQQRPANSVHQAFQGLCSTPTSPPPALDLSPSPPPIVFPPLEFDDIRESSSELHKEICEQPNSLNAKAIALLAAQMASATEKCQSIRANIEKLETEQAKRRTEQLREIFVTTGCLCNADQTPAGLSLQQSTVIFSTPE